MGPCKLQTQVTKTQTVKEEVTKTQGLILSRHSLGDHHENFGNSITDKPLSPQANCKVVLFFFSSSSSSSGSFVAWSALPSRLYCIMFADAISSILNDVSYIYAVSTSTTTYGPYLLLLSFPWCQAHSRH